ncbi:MAG: hypothetical protein DMG59_00605 [Acidobacteria bacterium]|nr:MAG: hypothetical protein DMG59_00605 [Acidobacteriota bacterium]
MRSDLRYAFRVLLKSPGFALTAVLALALGIGANTAIFSAVNSILYHPPGISDAERVVTIRINYEQLKLKEIGNSVMDFKDARDQKDVFSAVATGTMRSYNYATSDSPVRLLGAQVTSQWFDVFGTRPILGRSFTTDEDQPAANYVIVLEYGTWQRYFGKDPSVIGRTVTLNQQAYKVVGVMPPGFQLPPQADFWVPLAIPPAEFNPGNRHNQHLNMFARLRPGIPFERALTTTAMLTQRVYQNEDQHGFAKSSKWSMTALRYLEFTTGDLRTPMLVLLGAVGFVLLIACSNIAGLLLARASGRSREIAVRAALGAGRWQLIRQLLVESGLLAFSGGVLGLAAGFAGLRLLLLLAPVQIAARLVINMDLRVLVFAIAITVVSGMLFGLAPAWQLSRADQYESLKEGGRSGTAGKARQRLRGALVSAEVALALMLLVGAGLFLRSLTHLQQVDTGFNPSGVASGMIMLPEAAQAQGQDANKDKEAAFYRSVVDRLLSSPGVRSAAAIVPLPFSGDNWGASFTIEGREELPGDPGPHGDVRYITPAYFAAMGIPIRRGRAFTDQDAGALNRVAIVDEELARQYWPNEDPIGKHIRNGSRSPWATIVGVVGHVRQNELSGDSKKGAYYFPMYQSPVPLAAFIVKGGQGANAIREAVRAAEPTQSVFDLKSMDQRIAESLGPRRFAVTLLAAFAIIAVGMAALGIYGVISYAVTQRTQEIGIRMALGAERSEVLKLILGHGLRLAGAGVVIGLIASAALTRIVTNQLFQVSRFDPATFIVTALALISVALIASYIPARRAMGVDPTIALRYE